MTEESWVRRPQQVRSQKTEERIVEAAFSLLEQKRFEEITVAEIARLAGVSVGGFYARFPSKDSLLHWFEESLVHEILGESRVVLDPQRWEGQPTCEIIRAYVGFAAEAFRARQSLLRQIALRARSTPDSDFRKRIQEVNQELHDQLRGLLRSRASEMGHADPTVAIELGLNVVSSALRETILFADFSRSNFDPLDPQRLIDELTRLYCSYLDVPYVERTNESKGG